MNESKAKEPAVLIEVKRFACHCVLCNHQWTTRSEQLPKACTRCGSRRWSNERRYPIRTDKYRGGKVTPHLAATFLED